LKPHRKWRPTVSRSNWRKHS